MVVVDVQFSVHRSPKRPPVLIGDDNEGFRELLADLLADEGFDVREAGDGEEVLAEARRAKPGLLLLDVKMPMVSGLEAYRRIRRDLQMYVPAVFLTTGPSAELLEEAKRLGALAMVDKAQLELSALRQLFDLIRRGPQALEAGRIQQELQALLNLLFDPAVMLRMLREWDAALRTLYSRQPEPEKHSEGSPSSEDDRHSDPPPPPSAAGPSTPI